MDTVLLTLRLRRKRDLLRARQRVRQVARLLGLDAVEQLSLPAVVFEVCAARCPGNRLLLDLILTETSLEIHLRAPRVERSPATLLVQKQPPARPALMATDLRWTVRQLELHTPLGVLEEVRQLNNDLLRTLLELQRQRRPSDPGQPEHAA